MVFTYVASGGLGTHGTTGWAATPWSYVGSGSLSIKKCGIGVVFTPNNLCLHRFNPGDTAYLGFKAAQGVLEYVVIKHLRLIAAYPGNGIGIGQCVVMYIDTFNALYNEWDLVTLTDAQALVNAYNQRILQEQARAGCLK